MSDMMAKESKIPEKSCLFSELLALAAFICLVGAIGSFFGSWWMLIWWSEETHDFAGKLMKTSVLSFVLGIVFVFWFGASEKY